MENEAKAYYTPYSLRTRCDLCPNHCLLMEGYTGKCQVRRAHQGKMVLDAYGEATIISVEPIEKRPIYHFKPGSKFLCIGTHGCTFSCVYCQNHELSQYEHELPNKVQLTVDHALNMAVANKCDGICMTYSEPIPCYEYLRDIAECAHAADMSFALKTNGYVEREPWRDILDVTDAVNIDWKALDPESYAKITRNENSPFYTIVTRAYEALLRDDVHVEISVPVTPDTKPNHFAAFRDFFDRWGRATPIHLLKVLPDHAAVGWDNVDNKTLFEIRSYLLDRLRFVYVHNVFGKEGKEARQTICPECNKVIIERDSLKVTVHPHEECNFARLLLG